VKINVDMTVGWVIESGKDILRTKDPLVAVAALSAIRNFDIVTITELYSVSGLGTCAKSASIKDDGDGFLSRCQVVGALGKECFLAPYLTEED
jgi:hypothetical protein